MVDENSLEENPPKYILKLVLQSNERVVALRSRLSRQVRPQRRASLFVRNHKHLAGPPLPAEANFPYT